MKHGDKRIILVDGEFAGAVNRVPAPDDLRSNMVRGGTPRETDLTPREREICHALGPQLRERGLIFVGIDVIDGFLTEINVTSPTGIRAIRNLGGPDVAAMVWDPIEKAEIIRAPFSESPHQLADVKFQRASYGLRHHRGIAETISWRMKANAFLSPGPAQSASSRRPIWSAAAFR